MDLVSKSQGNPTNACGAARRGKRKRPGIRGAGGTGKVALKRVIRKLKIDAAK